jgi:hypothetical protein
MRSIAFDTGPIISLTLNNIVWILEPLHARFGGEFHITKEVYNELVQRPLSTRKYKFEALQILPLITKGIIKIVDSAEIDRSCDELHALANHIYYARKNPICIVHRAEMQVLACCLEAGDETIVVDERTTRTLIESPHALKNQLEKKLHTKIDIDEAKLAQFHKKVKHLHVLRSFELAVIAFDLGLFDIYALKEEEPIVPDIRRAVLEGVLWGVKLAGCSVREDDITTMLEEQGQKKGSH